MVKGIVFTDCYKGQLLTDAKNRYDIVSSTQSYPFFESLLINKTKFNVGGLSFNYSTRPKGFKPNKEGSAEMILAKSSNNISSVYVPNLTRYYIGYGDVNTTKDAIIIVFDEVNKTIEIFIARGLKYHKSNLYNEVVEGYLDAEMEALRQTCINVLKS